MQSKIQKLNSIYKTTDMNSCQNLLTMSLSQFLSEEPVNTTPKPPVENQTNY